MRANINGKSLSLERLIRRAEWDFHTTNFTPPYTGCPDDELEECKVYESCRRSVIWRPLFSFINRVGWREEAICGSFSWGLIFDFLACFSEFPDIPWLKICPTKRRMIVERLRTSTPPALREISHEALVQHQDVRIEDFYLTGLKWPRGRPLLRKHQPVHSASWITRHSLEVNWQHSNEEIIKRFLEWLSQNRPCEFRNASKPGQNEIRSDTLRKSLNSIGAWTLFHHPKTKGLDIEFLISVTGRVRRDSDGIAFPPYTTKAKWLEAVQKASETISAITPESLLLFHPSGIKLPKFRTRSKFLEFTRIGTSQNLFEVRHKARIIRVM